MNQLIEKINTAFYLCRGDLLTTPLLKGAALAGMLLVLSACGGSGSTANPPPAQNIGNETPDLALPPPLIKAIKLQLSYVQNIAETLYYNSETSTQPFFIYQSEFAFINNTTEAVTISKVEVNDSDYLTNLHYRCAGKAEALPCSLQPGKSIQVFAKLADFSQTQSQKSAHLQLFEQANNGADRSHVLIGEYQIATEFVPYVAGYIAMRTLNARTDQPLYLAAAYGPNTLKFSLDASDQLYKGEQGSTMQFQSDSFQFPQTSGGIVYVPYGQSGTVYLSYEPFNYEAAPSPNQPGTPGYFTAEFTYLAQVPNPPAQCTATADSHCEQLTLDTTYVNFMQYFGSASSVGTSTYLPDNVLTGYGYAGATPEAIKKGTQAVFNEIYTGYQRFNPPWQYVAPATPTMTANYFATSLENGSVPNDTTILYAPIQLFQAGNSHNTPMSNDYYDDYITALWSHLASNPIYIDANSITNPAKTNCILKGQVSNEQLHFAPIAGHDCPNLAYVVPALVSASPPFASCKTGWTELNGTDCADTPNLTFDKFTSCDFVTAAGSNNCGATEINADNFINNTSLWGPNGTFRAIVGRAIASYQAAGLLPICSNSAMTPISQTSPMNQNNSRRAIATGLAFENPSCLTGLSARKPVYNLYSKMLSHYAQAYTYSYGDFLGMDATITYSRNAFDDQGEAGACHSASSSLFCQLPRALPITLKIH